VKITPRILAIKMDPECFALCVAVCELLSVGTAFYLCVVGCAVACEAD